MKNTDWSTPLSHLIIGFLVVTLFLAGAFLPEASAGNPCENYYNQNEGGQND